MSTVATTQPHQVVAHRTIVTIAAITSTLMQSLDGTIANVALPHMQASLNATPDQIAWVLTSYIVASAIMIPLTGFLALRFGRKRVFVLSIIGFTLSSALCGLATSIGDMVAFRIIQGLCGAALVPLSQSMMLDLYADHERGRAIAMWGVGVMIGPVLGPTLGGYLTEFYDWRWVFYINLPFGIIAAVIMARFATETPLNHTRKFAAWGFFVLAVGVGGLQLLLDRGESEDWFTSTEIVIWGTLAFLGIYLFITHMMTSKNPFIDPRILKDRNFMVGSFIFFSVALIMFTVLALTPIMLQNLLGYPVIDTGFLVAPRGVGMMIGMVVGGRIVNNIDARHLMAFGLVLNIIALVEMTGFSLTMGGWPIIWTGVVQGIGIGSVFVSINILSYDTLPVELRSEAAAIANAIRTLGSSLGISVIFLLLLKNTQKNIALMSENVTLTNEMMHSPHLPAMWDLATEQGRAAMLYEISRQAQMMAYITDFQYILIATIFLIPFVFLIKRQKIYDMSQTQAAVD